MKDQHIIDILDSNSFASLTEAQLAAIEAHSTLCSDCRRSYEAARLSVVFVKEHETFEPSPFFQTRVMAALRERQAANEVWGLGRMWRAAGALVSSMTATVALLAVLSVMLPATDETQVSLTSPDSAEAVMLDQNELTAEQQSDAQVLTTLEEFDESSVR
jgi:hypothetical protein